MAAPLTALLLVLALGVASSSGNDECKSIFLGTKRTLLMVADPGTFSGSPENKYYLENMVHTNKYATNNTVCGSIYRGYILMEPVLVVGTGIGPTTAALCVAEFLKCRSYIKQLVYSGTSGFSAQKGGVLNGDNSGPNPSNVLLRHGSVCVSPMAINWVCQQTDWTIQAAGYPNVNFYPGYFLGPEASFLYGPCIFKDAKKESFDLADEIYGVGQTNAFVTNAPARAKPLLESEKNYTALMTAGTGIQYEIPTPDGKPTVYGYKICSEIDGQFFFSGVPWEMSARNFTALLINLKFNTSLTQRDVVIANAEEGVGVAQIIQSYNALSSTTQPLAYTFVRGFSDYLHDPVTRVSDGTWRQVPFFRDFSQGYAYAIASYSTLVLSWLQKKCLKMGSPKMCHFTVSYTGPP